MLLFKRDVWEAPYYQRRDYPLITLLNLPFLHFIITVLDSNPTASHVHIFVLELRTAAIGHDRLRICVHILLL